MNLLKNLDAVSAQFSREQRIREQLKHFQKQQAQLQKLAQAGEREKKEWLDAARADNVLLYMESGQPCREALSRCSGCLTIGVLSLLFQGVEESNPDVRIMRGGQSAIQQTILHHNDTPDSAMVTSISIAMERAMDAIEKVPPTVFVNVLHTIERHRLSVEAKKALAQ